MYFRTHARISDEAVGGGGGGGIKIRRIVTAVFQFRMFVKTLMPSL